MKNDTKLESEWANYIGNLWANNVNLFHIKVVKKLEENGFYVKISFTISMIILRCKYRATTPTFKSPNLNLRMYNHKGFRGVTSEMNEPAKIA